MSHRVFRRCYRRSRPFVTALALVAYLATLWGYPVARVQSSDGVPYPCQGHFCGCQSAAQCWQNCCCYTPSERLAWAKTHGVEVPAPYQAAMLAAADHETGEHHAVGHDHDLMCPESDELACAADHDAEHHDASHYEIDHDDDHCAGEHCHGHHRASEKQAVAVVAVEGGKPACTHCRPSSEGQRSEGLNADGGVVWVLGFQAQKCRGISVLWVASGASLPGVTLAQWQFEWRLAGRVVDVPFSFNSLAVIPPVPPPRA
jgi:hypothetical protein